MKIIKIISIIVVFASIIWFLIDPGFDPLITLGGSLITFITLFFVEKKREKGILQKQKVSSSSVGIQAGGNITINQRDNE